MIVSLGRGCIFVHIPKTGGTSMALALEARAMKDDVLIGDTPKAQRRKARLKTLPARGRLWKHARLSDLAGWLDADDLARLFVFTLVRNPWDRMVSYYHWLQVQQFDHPAVALSKELGFSDFLHHPGTERAARHDGAASYVTTADGEERCDAYVRLEHLSEDLAPVEAHLGFALRPDHVNRSERPDDYRRLYSDADAERVATLYRDDIIRFAYRF